MVCTANEDGHESTLDLSFLDGDKKYEATIYSDADNANYATNPQAYVISKKKVTAKTKLKMKAAPGGGYAISLKPIK